MLGIPFFETTAKAPQSVENIFTSLIDDVQKRTSTITSDCNGFAPPWMRDRASYIHGSKGFGFADRRFLFGVHSNEDIQNLKPSSQNDLIQSGTDPFSTLESDFTKMDKKGESLKNSNNSTNNSGSIFKRGKWKWTTKRRPSDISLSLSSNSVKSNDSNASLSFIDSTSSWNELSPISPLSPNSLERSYGSLDRTCPSRRVSLQPSQSSDNQQSIASSLPQGAGAGPLRGNSENESIASLSRKEHLSDNSDFSIMSSSSSLKQRENSADVNNNNGNIPHADASSSLGNDSRSSESRKYNTTHPNDNHEPGRDNAGLLKQLSMNSLQYETWAHYLFDSKNDSSSQLAPAPGSIRYKRDAIVARLLDRESNRYRESEIHEDELKLYQEFREPLLFHEQKSQNANLKPTQPLSIPSHVEMQYARNDFKKSDEFGASAAFASPESSSLSLEPASDSATPQVSKHALPPKLIITKPDELEKYVPRSPFMISPTPFSNEGMISPIFDTVPPLQSVPIRKSSLTHVRLEPPFKTRRHGVKPFDIEKTFNIDTKGTFSSSKPKINNNNIMKELKRYYSYEDMQNVYREFDSRPLNNGFLDSRNALDEIMKEIEGFKINSNNSIIKENSDDKNINAGDKRIDDRNIINHNVITSTDNPNKFTPSHSSESVKKTESALKAGSIWKRADTVSSDVKRIRRLKSHGELMKHSDKLENVKKRDSQYFHENLGVFKGNMSVSGGNKLSNETETNDEVINYPYFHAKVLISIPRTRPRNRK